MTPDHRLAALRDEAETFLCKFDGPMYANPCEIIRLLDALAAAEARAIEAENANTANGIRAHALAARLAGAEGVVEAARAYCYADTDRDYMSGKLGRAVSAYDASEAGGEGRGTDERDAIARYRLGEP